VTETFALTAIAYLQPVTRGEISRLAGREISRDVIASLKRHGLIDGAIRAPQPGAPFAYVTTKTFLPCVAPLPGATKMVRRYLYLYAARAGLLFGVASPPQMCLPQPPEAARRAIDPAEARTVTHVTAMLADKCNCVVPVF